MDSTNTQYVIFFTTTAVSTDQSKKSDEDPQLSISPQITRESQTTVKSNFISRFLKKLQKQTHRTADNAADTRVEHMKLSRVSRCFKGFIKFHFKNWKKIDKILVLFHLLAIIGLLVYGIIDTVMYSKNSKNKPDALKFIHNSRYISLEILTIIYGSSAAAFGISIEIYLLLIQAIVNALLVSRTCGGSDEATTGIVWVIKLILLFLAVELCHRNFRKLQKYNDHFNSSTRFMFRQAFFIGLAMLAENLEALKVVFLETNSNIPHVCKYETSHCGIVNLYEPLFGYDNLICIDHLSEYTAGREQIRLLRNFILLNIVSYSIFNKHFLKLNGHAKYLWIRILLVSLFVALSTSILISSIDPLFFIRSSCRLVYAIIEIIIFIIIMGLMVLNLYQLRHEEENLSEEVGEMDKTPTLLPKNH